MAVIQHPFCEDGFVYLVRPGDTYYLLSRRFGTSIQAIVAANPGVDPNRLMIGQQICIPVVSLPGVCPGGNVPYRIRFGDTLYAISRRFGTTVDVIMSSNPGLNPYRLRVGQWICLPVAAAGPEPGPLPRTPFRPPFGPPMQT